MKRRDDPEFSLQCAVAEHLRLRLKPGVYYTALPLGEYRAKRTAGRIKAMGARAGAPDFLVIVGGLAFGLELKADKKGRLSEAQKSTQQQWSEAGAFYAVAHGIDEALALLERWGAIEKSRAAA